MAFRVVKNLISVLHFRYFDTEELRLLLSIIRDEKFDPKKNHAKQTQQGEPITPIELSTSAGERKRFEILNANVKKDPYSKFDSYKIDFDTFRLLMVQLTDWGKCQHVDLAEKLFRVKCLFEHYSTLRAYVMPFQSLTANGQTKLRLFGF